MKYLLSLLLFLSASAVSAQRNIVESLQTRQAGEGSVTIHQDEHITSLIGLRYVRSNSSQGSAAANNKVSKGERIPSTGIRRKQLARSTHRSQRYRRKDKRRFSRNTGIHSFPISALAVPRRRFQEHGRGIRHHAQAERKRQIQRSGYSP